MHVLLKAFVIPELLLYAALRALKLRLLFGELLLAALFVPFAASQIILWMQELDESRRARALGARRFKVARRWPFAVDSLAKAGLRAKSEEPIQSLYDLFQDVPGEDTVDMRLEGDCSLLTRDPRVIAHALSDDFQNFSKGEVFMKPAREFIGHMIFTSDPQDDWKEQRSLLRPFFSQTRTRDLEIYRPHVDRLLEIIGTGETVEASQVFSAYFFQSATELFLGESVPVQSADTERAAAGRRFLDAFDTASAITANRVIYEVYEVVEFFLGNPLKPQLEIIHSFIDPVIKRIIAGELGEDSLAGQYAVQAKGDAKAVRDSVLGIMLGAKDTLTSLLTSTICMLAQHPGVMKRARDEVLSVCGVEEVQLDHIQALTYARAVLDETLRLFPPVAANIRFCTSDTTVQLDDGYRYFIPGGAYVSYSLYHAQRLASAHFEPGRQLDNAFFQPFHAGPRACIGRDIAYTQATYVLARLLQRFRAIEPNWSAHPSPIFATTLRWRDGVQVRFVPA